ncbi:MAG: four helix bundle protein [Opitutales bacterium]
MSEQLKNRTKAYTVSILRWCEGLPPGPRTWVIGKQLIRSASSIGANYRASTRSRSTAEFIAKLGIAIEEADETLYWLEVLKELDGTDPHREQLHSEGEEILRILVSSRNKSRSRLDQR